MSTVSLPNAVANRYKTTQVQTCSPAELVLLLLDGVIRFSLEAEQAILKKDRARAGERTSRCHAIIEELAAGLDPQHAPDLCANLSAVYEFCGSRLLQANLEQKPEHVRDVITAIRPIRDGWAQMLGKP